MDAKDESSEFRKALSLAGELRVINGKLKRRFREQAPMGDLSWSQVSVLAILERDGPSTVTALAQAERMRPQSMGAIVATLEAAGLVTGTTCPNDKRQTILAITEECREKIQLGRSAREDWLAHSIVNQLNSSEQDELAHAVALLKRLVDS